MNPDKAPDTVTREVVGMPWPRLRRQLLLLAAGPVAFLLFQLLSRTPWVVERVYATGVGPWIVRLLAGVTGLVPFGVVELFLAGFLIRHVILAVKESRVTRARGRAWAWGGAAWLLRLGVDLSVLAALFYLVWGLNYARPTLEERLGWPRVEAVGAEELRRLAEEAVEMGNRAYVELHGGPDAGRPTSRPLEPAALRRVLDAGWERTGREVDLGPGTAFAYGPVKELLIPGLLSRLGIFGFYFPFTAEPVVNGELPGVSVPKSWAHEQAHQRGVAPEDEANFAAFLATVHSPDPWVRYSGWFYVQQRLLVELGVTDREGARALARRRHPGVRRDVEALQAFVASLQGPVNEVTERVNHAYLRSNRVEGGIRSYGLVTRLLVARARGQDGRLEPEG